VLPTAPASAQAYACTYHPVIGESWPWIGLGLLAGTWLAFAIAASLVVPPRALRWAEVTTVAPVMTAVVWWALVIGPQQAGGGYVGLFIACVAFTAVLRLLLGTTLVRKMTSAVLARLGMVSRPQPASG
jgi:hypothetical protein